MQILLLHFWSTESGDKGYFRDTIFASVRPQKMSYVVTLNRIAISLLLFEYSKKTLKV